MELAEALYVWTLLALEGAPIRPLDADSWLGIADRALRAAPVAGWERVTTDALFNALVSAGCTAGIIAQANDRARAAPTPRDPELIRFATLTQAECEMLTP
jgi:hypothetical protein